MVGPWELGTVVQLLNLPLEIQSGPVGLDKMFLVRMS